MIIAFFYFFLIKITLEKPIGKVFREIQLLTFLAIKIELSEICQYRAL